MRWRDACIRVIADREADALRLAHELLCVGFSARADSPQTHTRGRDDCDIVVLIGSCKENGGGDFTSLRRRYGDNLILFFNDLRAKDYALLTRAGVRFISTTPAVTVESVIYFISLIDPELVYRVAKLRLLRSETSKVIENGSLAFFRELRGGGMKSAINAAGAYREEIGDLVLKSPMSVWLELFQNYHDGTAQHCTLVSSFALLFAKALGFAPKDIDRMYDAAFFHDVGKAMVPLEVLDKPGRLDEREWDLMKRHVLHGYDILMRDEKTAGEIARVARDHHEYLDGTGYPNGIGAAEIDDPTRILTICDIFAALVEKRAYKPPRRTDEAFDILKSMAGTKLDPDLVKIFEGVVDAYDFSERRTTAMTARQAVGSAQNGVAAG